MTWGDWFTRPEPEAPKPTKATAPRQDKALRLSLVEQAEAGIAAITAAKLNASATARDRIDHASRVHAADTAGKDRKRVRNQCLGQRNALVRILRNQEGVAELSEMTDRVRGGLDIILALSANVAALSRSGWPEAQGWLDHQVLLLMEEHRDWMRGRFEWHLHRARAQLAKTVATRWTDYRTAPYPADIAHTLMITTAVLRGAGANKVGLTSIDPESKRDRDRRNAEKRRRDQRRQPQSERTKDAELRALAQELGCSLRSLYNHRADLDTYVAKLRAKRA